MKQQLQLTIPQPCHESWNNMTATQQGRFCASCSKQVVDFSAMTDQQIVEYMSTATSSTCGRANLEQLNRMLTSPEQPRRNWWRYWMSVAASVVLLSSRSQAQAKVTPPIVCTPPQTVTMGTVAIAPRPLQMTITGRIVDDNKNPVPYATVHIEHSRQATTTDRNGIFSIKLNNTSTVVLKVSATGYESTQINVTNNGNEEAVKVNIHLKPLVSVLTGKIVAVNTTPRKSWLRYFKA